MKCKANATKSSNSSKDEIVNNGSVSKPLGKDSSESSENSPSTESSNVPEFENLNQIRQQQKQQEEAQQQSTLDPSDDELSDGILVQNSDSQSLDLSEIKREAVLIATNVMEKAKVEVAKQNNENLLKNLESNLETTSSNRLSLEISDEELVERGSFGVLSPDTPITKQQFEIVSTSKTETIKSDDNIKPTQETVPETISKEMISSSESFGHLSTNSTTSSRPTSSEYDLTIIPEASQKTSTETTTGNQYITAVSSQETSYYTAKSSLASELSSASEGSETIVPDDPKTDDEFEEQYHKTSLIDTDSMEPFSSDITASQIRESEGKDEWEMLQAESATMEHLATEGSSGTTTFQQYLNYEPPASPFGIIDKNLYTHLEVDEDQDDSLDSLKRPGPLSSFLAQQKQETEPSSTSSSLREFERLESELKDRSDASPASADFSIDSKFALESGIEKLPLDTETEESLDSINSELSQATIIDPHHDSSQNGSQTSVVKTKVHSSKSLDVETKTFLDDSNKSNLVQIFDDEKRVFSVDNIPGSSIISIDKPTEFQYTESKDLSQLSSQLKEAKDLMQESFSAISFSESRIQTGPMTESLISFSLKSDSSNPILECDQISSMQASMIASLTDMTSSTSSGTIITKQNSSNDEDASQKDNLSGEAKYSIY